MKSKEGYKNRTIPNPLWIETHKKPNIWIEKKKIPHNHPILKGECKLIFWGTKKGINTIKKGQ